MEPGQERIHDEDIGKTVREFELWRASRRRGARIPASLWRSATSLAAKHGVSKVSMALRVDYYALKKRWSADSGGTGASQVTAQGPARFVEMSLSSAASTVTCAIEIEKHTEGAEHSKLRLELGGVALGDLDAVLRSVWSGRA